MKRRLALPTAALAAMALMASNAPVWAAAGDDPFDALRNYTYGDNRAVLQALQQRVNDSRSGTAARQDTEARLLGVLDSDATQDAKEFVCAQLRVVGTAHSVPTLAALLDGEDLAFAARAALERIPAAEAGQALLDALPKTTGPQRIGLIASLGNRRERSAVQTLTECLNDPEMGVREAAALALAEIANTGARDALIQAAEALPGQTYNRALLRCAARLREDGDADQAASLYDQLYRSDGPAAMRAAGLTGLLACRPDTAPDLLADALTSDTPKVRRAAIETLRRGLPGAKVTEAAGAALSRLPREDQVLLINALAQRGDRAAYPAVLLAADSAGTHAAALRALGALGAYRDVPLLVRCVAEGDEPAREAALHALAHLRDPHADREVLEAVSGAEPATAAALIEVLASRAATQMYPELMQLAEAGPGPVVQAAAGRAAGALAPPQDLVKLIDLFIRSRPEAADGIADGLWQMLRRAPDLNSALKTLDAAANGAPGEKAETLRAIAGRAREELIDKTVATTAISPDDPALPDGYTMVAHLNCGPEPQTSQPGGPLLELLQGEPWTFQGVRGPLSTVAFHGERVVYRAAGLDPSRRYVLGFSWWDVDGGGRVQSVSFQASPESEPVAALPPAPAAAYGHGQPTWARCLLPVPGTLVQNGSFRIDFAREAGPNAVVNELWLLEAPAKNARKHVLIITGDDYPGHVWRETAPALAGVLRQDERLAVSITEAPAMIGSPLLSAYDAVVVHFKNYAERTPLTPEYGENLADYASSGKGLVLTHFACGAFQEWDGFEQLAGRVWNPELRGHDPYGAFQVEVTDTAHPVTQGMVDFTVTDELYTCLDGETAMAVLCEAVSKVDGKTYPIAFIVPEQKGRVFHCVLGHDATVYANPDTAALFRRGTAWAAGL